ncbi:PP2C family protein-serine/threonine phosphatase [Roseivirga sp. BDSF3-8]|uniref:PP2C family protein-serine/threonine phosphatase n=1 Tax=Roseivirga sp. BDSF3-8 TaxID=3241598 RepID=UPI0035318A12
MDTLTLKDKYELKELELNALLEVTEAINSNLPEASLYKIYSFILRANLNISKMALFVYDDEWSLKTDFGTKLEFENIALEESFFDLKDITRIDFLSKRSPFREFEVIIPVAHKNQTLAFVLISGVEGQGATEVDTNFIEVLSNIILVAIENKKLARRQLRQEAFRKEMEIAKHVQQLLFPKELPKVNDVQVEASYLPHHNVGGDYYDYILLDKNKFLLCIADVSGKGVPAAILMSNFQASLRTLARKTINLYEIIGELNYQVMQSANGENFITFFACIYDKKKRELSYVNAGHNPPFLIRRGHDPEELRTGSTILGMIEPLPFLNVGKVEDISEFLLFSYTDGFTETFNEEQEQFGQERLHTLLQNTIFSDLNSLHLALLGELDSFKGERDYDDDITLLSCRVNLG